MSTSRSNIGGRIVYVLRLARWKIRGEQAPWPGTSKPIPPKDLVRASEYVRERGWVR